MPYKQLSPVSLILHEDLHLHLNVCLLASSAHKDLPPCYFSFPLCLTNFFKLLPDGMQVQEIPFFI